MSDICSKRGCEHPKFGDNKYCIFHCDKKDFDDNQINTFWSELREEYPHQYNEELVIKDINFPKFQVSYYYGGYFYNENFRESVKLVNCNFTNDFIANGERFNQGITFEKCTFYGNIKFEYAKFLELDNCEFKNEFSFKSVECRNLEIKNTKFIKECNITSQYPILIDDKSIFRDKTYLSSNKLVCQNTTFDKELQVNNISFVEFDSLNLKSNVKFLKSFGTIVLRKTIFPKSLSFEYVNKLIFENIKINDSNFQSIDHLEINSSIILGDLEFKNNLDNLKINTSTLQKEIKTNNVLNTEIHDSSFNDTVYFYGNQNDINILNSNFNKININTTHTTNIKNSEFSEFICLGDTYQIMNLDDVKVENSIDLNNIKETSLHKIKAAFLTSSGNQFENFKLNEYRISQLVFEAKEYTEISIGLGLILCDIYCIAESIKKLFLNSYKIKLLDMQVKSVQEIIGHKCHIRNVNIHVDKNVLLDLEHSDITENINIKLNQSKDIKFESITSYPSAKIDFNEISSINLSNSDFNQLYINSSIVINSDEIEQKENALDLVACNIENNCGIYNISKVGIIDSRMNKGFNCSEISSKLDLIKSEFKQIDFADSRIELILTESLKVHEFIDFSRTVVNKLMFLNSSFDQIYFNENLHSLVLDNIYKSHIRMLSINHNKVVDLFKNSIGVLVEELNLNNTQLTSADEKSEITINDITINDFKCNQLSIEEDVNLDNMKINKFRVSNSNIEKTLRIRYSEIEEMFFVDSTFEDLQIIDNQNDKQMEKRGLRLKNTTIKSTVLDKLKLDNFNMSDAHVSDAKIGFVKFNQGSRETNRFFKNYYDSISDYIKANSYYKDEMEEQFKTTKRYGSEWWILLFNKVLSNFGQDWVRPLLLILVVTLAIFTTINFDNFTKEDYILNNKLLIWNSYWEFLNPFSKTANEKYKDVYWLWMSHKLLLTVFIYHFIVAIKRKTKR